MPDVPKILDIDNVTVSFDGFTVLDGLNFSMNYGELRFLIGPNGAGKTTLLDIITGKTKPNKGKVTFDRYVNLLKLPIHTAVKYGVARKFQTPTVFYSLSVYENLEAAVGSGSGSFGLMGRLSSEKRDRIDSTLEKIGLKRKARTRAGTLAHGEKQWLEIGMLLIQEPKLLLLDEPVAGMTRHERTRTGEMLQEIAKERSILVVEHDMEFMRAFARTVSVLHSGSLLCEGSIEEVQNDPRVIEVYLGRSKEGSPPPSHKGAGDKAGHRKDRITLPS